MPQLLSRMDQSGWLTPPVADILERGTPPPGGEETIRSQAMELQRVLGELGAPARIINVRPTSSRTLYIARPDNRRESKLLSSGKAVTIVQNFSQLVERQHNWRLGLVPQMREPNTVGILLQTEQHRPLTLRQLLGRNAYREQSSRLSLVMGVTLEQQLIVRDLATSGHLLLVGEKQYRQPFMWGTLLTLILMNTPTELRLALVGDYDEPSANSIETAPHVLGRLLSSPKEGQRLLDGLGKEVQRRRQWFYEKKVETVEAYNATIQENDRGYLPHIVLVVNSISGKGWLENQDRWTPSLYDLLMNGSAVGIHIILTADSPDHVPEILSNALATQIVLHPNEEMLRQDVRYLHNSSMRFIDALLIDTDKETRKLPLETYTVEEEEIQRMAAYWRYAAEQRVQGMQGSRYTARTGVTGYLSPKPDTGSLRQGARSTSTTQKIETGSLQRVADALADAGADPNLQRAQALAAYLGWLGVGPLQDILGLTPQDAQDVLSALQDKGVLEGGDNPVLRFMRLAENPLNKNSDK